MLAYTAPQRDYMYIRKYVYQHDIAIYRCRLSVSIFHRELCWQYQAAFCQMFEPICRVGWHITFVQAVGIVCWLETLAFDEKYNT